MDNWILFLALLFLFAVLVSSSATSGTSSVPSLTKREKRHLKKLRNEFTTILSDDDFFWLALELWRVGGIKPIKLRRSSNFLIDFNVSPQDLSAFVGKIGRGLDSDIISLNVDQVSTLHDLVKQLEVEYLAQQVECPVCEEKGCPKCGFTYQWDGRSCNHCGYSR